VVLCADSQETISIPERGEFRVNVNKIEKSDAGEYEVVIGGSGDGDLVDDFVEQLSDRISGWPAVYTETEMRDDIRNFTQHYHEVYVALSPADPADKHLAFIVCVKNKSRPEVFLWRVSDLRVSAVRDKTLLGWEEAIYWHEVDHLYQPNWVSNHAILLGLHLFTIAKATSNYISGPTKVLLVCDRGVFTIPPDDVEELERMLSGFNKKVDELRLILPNTTIPFAEFAAFVRQFADDVINMKRELLGRMSIKMLFEETQGDVFQKLPLGMQIRTGGINRPTEIFEYGHPPEQKKEPSDESETN